MDLYQIHEAIALNRSLIADTWQFFVTVHIALFGLMFSIDSSKINILSRIVLTIAYAGFMYLNYRAQIDNYTYTKLLINLGTSVEVSTDENETVFNEAFKAGWVLDFLKYIYGTAATAGLLLISIPHNTKPKRTSVDE